MPGKLKHEKEWAAAVRALTDPDYNAKKDQLLQTKQAVHSLQQMSEKDLMVATTPVFGRYATVPVNQIDPVTRWVVQLAQKLGTPHLHQVAPVVETLHPANTQAAAGTGARAAVDAWIDALPQQRRTLGAVTNLVQALTQAGFNKPRIRTLWTDLGIPAGQDTLLALIGLPIQVPAWLDKASQHAASLVGAQFWMHAVQGQAAAIRRIAEVAYTGNSWSTASARVNAAATLWAQNYQAAARCLEMFTVAEWLEIETALGQRSPGGYLVKLAAVGAAIPQRRKRRTNRAQEVDATLRDLGEWLHHHREVVLELLEKGYAETVLAMMYEEALEHRELVTCTWFRGAPVSNLQQHIVAFKAVKGMHGFVIANTNHLAQRHLYKHFDFQPNDAIKAENSFHPRDTSQDDLAGLDLVVGKANGLVLVDGYQVFIVQTDPKKEHSRWIRSLYPDLPINHRDYYTRDKLERIAAVMAAFPVPYQNALPMLDWRDAPRAAQN